MYRVSLVIAVVWTCTVLLAIASARLSASAGILPKPWLRVGMIFGLLNVALVVVAMWNLPARVPRIAQRLLQLVGMAGAFWSAGTLTRAVYALTV